ncbi:TadE family type IV pilus minor pilin [Rhodococcus sp. NPDC058521]|uniref:TadE family type IV pilus minor pilin n=1 Tax=Rhodococcus sp. NPDC058521 TaxID=3346536 RepID=UPI00366085BA
MRAAIEQCRDERGAVTVEAAIAIASIVTVVVLCIGAIVAATLHIRCVDAAREAARLAARGDDAVAVSTAAKVAPDGAKITLRMEGDLVVATVEARSSLLPLVDITAGAVAAVEPYSDSSPRTDR